ncbi:MAG TPA: Ig-like domain-containing protein [Thermoanaerobaculia bacterium]|nr:Ig-like domain-containing protein [Thermoanaerobaculia bacterium]
MKRILAALLLLLLMLAPLALAQDEPDPEPEPRPLLNETCTISILNRSAQVAADGGWVIANVPTNVGLVRARATCVENGITRSGQSDYFLVPNNGIVQVADVQFDQVLPIVAVLRVTAPVTNLGTVGATVQLTATAEYADNRSADVTGAARGTNFFSSNDRVATVNANGLVTAQGSGAALVSAMNEGALGMLLISVVTTGDADGDGLPDDYELQYQLDPNNPADAQQDPDSDGLTNLQEFQAGTHPRQADTDGDTLSDGEETILGNDGYLTNPLLADTDGDGLRDGLEVQTGSDPTNPNSYDLTRALANLTVTPSSATLIVNTLFGQAYTQLNVTGELLDGNTIDLTSTSRGTNYSSADLNVCNFGVPDGRIFAGIEGTTTVTVTVGGRSVAVPIVVRNFTPSALAAINIPGHANAVDARGNYAYVAAGSAGLHIVDVSNPAAPAIVATVNTPGNANDVKVAGNFAYVADGSSLQIINVTNPLAPATAGSVALSGATDVAVGSGLAYVAAGGNGLVIVNVTTPGAPIVVGSVQTPSSAVGVDLAGTSMAIVVDGSGLRSVNVSNPAAPVITGNTSIPGSPNDLRVSGNYAYVAAYTGGLQIVDVTSPSNPHIVGSIPGSAPLGFIPYDVALAGSFALAADVLFVNAVPISDVGTPTAPVLRTSINFSSFGDYNGNGITVNGAYLYMTGSTGGDRGTTGSTRLFVGQYLPLEDRAGNPPQVRITAPLPGSQQIEGDTILVSADATDDIAVNSVTFTIGNEDGYTDTSVPYERLLTVPLGVSSITLGASATDMGENVGTAAPVVVSVIPDPLTTVTGLVVDINGAPLAGATVTVNGGSTAQTASNGTFTISGVTTIRGPIVANANATAANGEVLTGSSSAVVANRGGTTAVGTIVAVSAIFEPNYGTFITTCDDCAFLRTLPFSFPYYGTQRTQAFVGTNGYITFNNGDSTYSESLPAFSSLPRISAFFDDLIGGGGMWINDQLPGRFIVTYKQNQHYNFGGSNTLQIILFSDGRIQFGYAGITALTSGSITGLTPGPNAPPQQVDFSANQNFNSIAGAAVYEYFTNTNRFDLDGGFVVFTPRGDGGYNVRTILQPPPAADLQVTNGTGDTTARLVTSENNGNAKGKFAKAEVEIISSTDPSFRAVTNADKHGVFTLKNVPAGGIEVTVRRKGDLLGHGAAVLDGKERSYTIEILPPVLEQGKP